MNVFNKILINENFCSYYQDIFVFPDYIFFNIRVQFDSTLVVNVMWSYD